MKSATFSLLFFGLGMAQTHGCVETISTLDGCLQALDDTAKMECQYDYCGFVMGAIDPVLPSTSTAVVPTAAPSNAPTSTPSASPTSTSNTRVLSCDQMACEWCQIAKDTNSSCACLAEAEAVRYCIASQSNNGEYSDLMEEAGYNDCVVMPSTCYIRGFVGYFSNDDEVVSAGFSAFQSSLAILLMAVANVVASGLLF